MNILSSSNNSTFESIRRVDDSGLEYWLATELLTLLGYKAWKRIKETVERAKISARISGQDELRHFVDVVQMAQIGGSQAFRQVLKDFKLSRYGCYLVAMNGDPRKPEIAAAQAYFVVKTREAEVVIPQQSETIKELELQLALQREINRGLEIQQRGQELDNSMIALHGVEVVLALRGKQDQLVRVETIATEIVEPQTGSTAKILTADQLKAEIKKRTGQKVPSQKWITDKLRKLGRDDLLLAVTRHYTNEYVKPEALEEAITLLFGTNRQMLLGETPSKGFC
ncbi:hypothetical protein PCC6912_50860 [Chlorogloeopsis fritschii PCC 6912]|uniref:Bro-N domain-containing protein n=1 Tax=Chlorogloeopsis fritschii PCC 6912 TaxID=211165 RepID=A0A433N1M2_CHLFR|nr:BRO family protein [Chlorogloeopsis fritschii]RUR74908.1 hypothetical protein PCC6912_50860 [Chlorogloeopsis fritschii PCC 6912]